VLTTFRPTENTIPARDLSRRSGPPARTREKKRKHSKGTITIVVPWDKVSKTRNLLLDDFDLRESSVSDEFWKAVDFQRASKGQTFISSYPY
jgi:hypothetical protein